MRITKVTTKKGDRGKTQMGNGNFVSKSSVEINVLGDLDELSSVLGLVKTCSSNKDFKRDIGKIQNDLLNLGGEVTMNGDRVQLLKSERLEFLEDEIKTINDDLKPLEEFLLPGGNELSARIHHARSVCRRGERSLTILIEDNQSPELWLQYMNRLSDYLFVLARKCDSDKNQKEQMWDRG